MALTINTNVMALNASRNLGNHYSHLSTSVRRLSSGLRVDTSADDAAGLAIRELMRADIATLNQGVRNATDAISMIQTMDGALQIIDEKLIRMKELAEQAATGTYNSDQRIMIDSEFQAMKSEITRIAMATDFNGIKLLCMDTANKLLLTTEDGAGAGTGPAITGQSGDILNPAAIISDAQINYKQSAWIINSITGDQSFANWEFSEPGPGAHMPAYAPFLGVDVRLTYDSATQKWSLAAETIAALQANGLTGEGGIPGPDISIANNSSMLFGINGYIDNGWWSAMFRATTPDDALTSDTVASITYTGIAKTTINSGGAYPDIVYMGNDLWDLDGDGAADIRTAHSGTRGRFGLLADGSTSGSASQYVTKIHFGTGNDSAEDYYYIYGSDCTADGLGIGGTSIETQAKGQHALEEIDAAIIVKDKVRAYLGATQNRLENTVSNLQIQAENLQAAESRISDVDVADEMTEFVRSQILSQAAVAMLSQANSMPQMALSLMK